MKYLIPLQNKIFTTKLLFVLLIALVLSPQNVAARDDSTLIRAERTPLTLEQAQPKAVQSMESARLKMLETLIGKSAESKENFVFSFMEAGPNNSAAKIHVRWSKDGLTWENGNFPILHSSTSTTLNATHGVGATARRFDGLFQWVLFDKPNNIVTVWGLGPAVWDMTGTTRPTGETSSAPDVVDLGGDLRLVVFQQNEKVVAKIYDHNSRSFLFSIALEQGALNSGVVGRPSVTYHSNGKILITWRRFSAGAFQVVTAVGEMTPPFNLPVFQASHINAVNLSSTEFTTIDSNPAVTHDANNFILAVNREQMGTGSGAGDPLHGWRTVIYKSSDGVAWSEHSRTSLLSTNRDNLINISSLSNGTMIMANIRESSGGNAIETAARYSNQSGTWKWDSLNKTALWGNKEASFKQFSLYSYGSDIE